MKEKNSAAEIYGWLHCMGASSVIRWVNMDTRTLLFSHLNNKHQNWMQWGLKGDRNRSTTWHTLYHTDDSDFGISESLFPLDPLLTYKWIQRRHALICHHTSFNNMLSRKMISCSTSCLVMKPGHTILIQKWN